MLARNPAKIDEIIESLGGNLHRSIGNVATSETFTYRLAIEENPDPTSYSINARREHEMDFFSTEAEEELGASQCHGPFGFDSPLP